MPVQVVKKTKKIKIKIDHEGNIDVEDFDEALSGTDGDSEIAGKTIIDQKTFEVVVTNPCTYVKILGTWYKICWG